MQLIVGYNFAPGNIPGQASLPLTAKWATLVSLFWFVASEFFPGLMVGMFTNDFELKSLSERGLRIMNPLVPIVGWQMVSTNFFQSLGMVGKSIFLSLSRQLLFLVPAIFVLPLFWETRGVFMAFPLQTLSPAS